MADGDLIRVHIERVQHRLTMLSRREVGKTEVIHQLTRWGILYDGEGLFFDGPAVRRHLLQDEWEPSK